MCCWQFSARVMSDLIVNLTPMSRGKRKPSREMSSIRLACKPVFRTFSSSLINGEEPNPLWVKPFPRLRDMCYIRKSAEQVSKHCSSVVGLSFHSCLQGPALASDLAPLAGLFWACKSNSPVLYMLLLVQLLPQQWSKQQQYAFKSKTCHKKILDRFPSFSPIATTPAHPQERQKMLN